MNILFDLDGTITDPAIGIRNGYKAAFKSVGMPPPEDSAIDAWIGPPLRESFPALGIAPQQVEKAIEGYRAVYTDTGWRENVVYQGMPSVLEQLSTDGRCLSIATAKPQDLARQILTHFKLDHHFEFIGGASLDTSRDSKAAVIEHVLRHLPTGEAIMVGDRKTDIQGAVKNGLAAIGVVWGYGSREELLKAGASKVADSPQELLNLLRAL